MKLWAEVEEIRSKNRDQFNEIVKYISDKNYSFQLKFFLNAMFPYMGSADRQWVYDIYYVGFLEADKQQWVTDPDPKTKRKRDARDWPTGGTGGLSFYTFQTLVEKLMKEETAASNESKYLFGKFPEREAMTKSELQATFKTVDATQDGNVSLLEFLMWRVPSYLDSLANIRDGDIVKYTCEQKQFDVASGKSIFEAQVALDKVKTKWDEIDAKGDELKKKAAGTGVSATSAGNALKQHIEKYTDLLRNTDYQNAQKVVRRAIKTAKDSKSLVAQGNSWFLAKEQADVLLRKSQSAQSRK